jgi:hypothetical protein
MLLTILDYRKKMSLGPFVRVFSLSEREDRLKQPRLRQNQGVGGKPSGNQMNVSQNARHNCRIPSFFSVFLELFEICS